MPTALPKPESPYAPFYPLFRKLLIVFAIFGAAFIHFAKDTIVCRFDPVNMEVDIQAFETALEVYQKENGFLPSASQGLQALVAEPAGDPHPLHWRPYFSELPIDLWGNAYIYEVPARRSNKAYDLYSRGKDRIANTPDDIGNWPGGPVQ